MDKILIPVLIVAGIGLLAGIILAVASAIMALSLIHISEPTRPY